jgi:general secretion pathway protein G
MIELIFVIVIIGILASVALPKLAATRSDAQGATIVHNLTTCINDAGNEYMMEHSFHHFTQDDNITSSCRVAKKCFSFTENDNNGTLQVDNLSSTKKECIEAQRIANKNILATTHSINF